MQHFKPQPIPIALVHELFVILSGVILLFACSQISIPLEPVPISLQTVGIMLIGLVYTKRQGLMSVASYLTAGAVGIPVFTNFTAGFHVLLGLKCGYLFGFLAAILVMNQTKRIIPATTLFGIFCNCMAGTAVIYILGVSWLAIHIGGYQAVEAGFIPFILPGIIKACILSLCLKGIRVPKKTN